MAKKVLTQNLSEPLKDSAAARYDIHTGTGNLTIEPLTSGEPLLATGTLEYLESQDPPAWTVEESNGRAGLTLEANGGRQPGFRLPWAACNGVTNWAIRINPTVTADLTARTGGGNVRLNLAGMHVTRAAANSGGGNLEMVLPENGSDLDVTAETGGGNVTVDIGSGTTGSSNVTAASGAGNVMVRLPAHLAARIHATTGMGKVAIDERFRLVDKFTYQSVDYEGAQNRVNINARSGAGNVTIAAQ